MSMVSITYDKDRYCRLFRSFRHEGKAKKKNYFLRNSNFPELYYINRKIVKRVLVNEIYLFYPMLKELRIDWDIIIKKVEKKKEEKRKAYRGALCEIKNRKNVKIESYVPDHLFLITDEKRIKFLVEYCLNNPILRTQASNLNETDKELDNIKDYLYQLIRLVESIKYKREELFQTYKNLPKSNDIDILIKNLDSKIKELANS